MYPGRVCAPNCNFNSNSHSPCDIIICKRIGFPAGKLPSPCPTPIPRFVRAACGVVDRIRGGASKTNVSWLQARAGCLPGGDCSEREEEQTALTWALVYFYSFYHLHLFIWGSPWTMISPTNSKIRVQGFKI